MLSSIRTFGVTSITPFVFSICGCLLCALVTFSSSLAVLILGGDLSQPTSFEAGARSALMGSSPWILHLCKDLYYMFCEARTMLRKAAFKDPKDSLVLRLIREDPFSKTLFGEEVREKVHETCTKFRGTAFKWEHVLKLRPKGNQQKPADAAPSVPWKAGQDPQASTSGMGRGQNQKFRPHNRGRGGRGGQKFRGRGGNPSFTKKNRGHRGNRGGQ